jgi:Nucleotidyl transferase
LPGLAPDEDRVAIDASLGAGQGIILDTALLPLCKRGWLTGTWTMTEPIIPLIMCGGAGTRLWPASREGRPKQFLRLFGPRSTFQETIRRVGDRQVFARPMIVTNHQYRFLVAEQACSGSRTWWWCRARTPSADRGADRQLSRRGRHRAHRRRLSPVVRSARSFPIRGVTFRARTGRKHD